MSDDDALKRAKRALAVLPKAGTAVAPVDKAKVTDLLARAREATKKPQAVIVQEQPRAALPVQARQSAPVQSAPPAVINHSVSASGEARQVEVPAQTTAAAGGNTIIINVTTEAAASVHPYPYFYPYHVPYWWAHGYPCNNPKCPRLRGKRCPSCR